MSRTYRKTSTKHGMSRRNWGVRVMAQYDHKKAKKPESYTIPSAFYETIIEEYKTEYRYSCPKELRTYVSQGTPHAIEELGSIICWQKYPLPPRREPSKWYLVPVDEVKIRTFRKYIGRNPEYSQEESNKVWEQERLFNHVRKNKTGARGSNAHRFDKRERMRRLRREGRNYLLNWEDEYHLNQHLEPFNWVLDDDFGMFDLIDEMEDWDRLYEDWHDYANTEVEPDDFYDYDPWGDDLDWYWDYD